MADLYFIKKGTEFPIEAHTHFQQVRSIEMPMHFLYIYCPTRIWFHLLKHFMKILHKLSRNTLAKMADVPWYGAFFMDDTVNGECPMHLI